MTTDPIAFGPFFLDLSTEQLHLGDVKIALRSQAFRALRALLNHSGQYVSYEQLLREAWDGVSVSRHTLIVTVGGVKKALGEYGSWIQCHPSLGYCLAVPESEELLRTGWHHLNRHTREGFEKALICFRAAGRDHGCEARAAEGLARGYLHLGVSGMRHPREAYSNFRKNYERAVQLGGASPELCAAHALGLHAFEHRFADAEAELLATLRQVPRSTEVYVRLAMLYVSWKRLDQAEAILEKARGIDCLAPHLPIAEILLHFCRRDFEKAAGAGRKVLEVHPYLHAARTFCASALEFLGRYDEALTEYRCAFGTTPDPWQRSMEATCLAKAGKIREAEEILQQLRGETYYVDGYHLSLLLAALGRTDEAFTELARAVAEGCPFLSMVEIDPKMDVLRIDPRFQVLVDRLAEPLTGFQTQNGTSQVSHKSQFAFGRA